MISAQSTASRRNRHGGTNFDRALRPLATSKTRRTACETKPGSLLAIVVVGVVASRNVDAMKLLRHAGAIT